MVKVAAHFGVPQAKLRQAIAQGHVTLRPPLGGRGWATVALAEVEAWIREHQIPVDL